MEAREGPITQVTDVSHGGDWPPHSRILRPPIINQVLLEMLRDRHPTPSGRSSSSEENKVWNFTSRVFIGRENAFALCCPWKLVRVRALKRKLSSSWRQLSTSSRT